MHQGIIEALKARARDIIIKKHERWLESMEVKDIALGNLIGKEKGHPGQNSSYISQKETSSRWGYSRSSRLSDGIFIERFTDEERKQVFHQEFQTCGIHGMMM